MKRIITHFTTALILALLIIFVAGCSGSSEAPAPTVPGATDATAAVTDAPINQMDSTAAITDTAEAPPASDTAQTGAVAPLETTAPKPVVSSGGGLAARIISENKLTTVLETVAREMEARKLAYVSSLGQDCSGIFHQLKDSVQVRIPPLADQSKYTYPAFSVDRNSRQIADWYYRNGNLLIVQDAMAERNKIRPGCVMFFGRTDEKYRNIDIDLLTNPGKFVHDGTKGKIMHVAVVTSVEKDDAGNVTAYTMMHGRNKKHNASRSGGNTDGPGQSVIEAHAKFPFGNWNQQWVAMAHIETPQ